MIQTVVVPGKAALLAVESRWTPVPRPAACVHGLDAVAHWERATIGERTTAVRAHPQAQGQQTGGDGPSGSRRAADGTTVLSDAAEQAWLVAIREARLRALAQRAVTTARTRKGTALRLMPVQRLMQQTQRA